jgi:hypothetical protein
MGQDIIKIPCSKTIGYIIYTFTFFLYWGFIIYLRIKSREKSKNEDKMSDTYPSNAPLRSVSKQEADCKYLLRDYYIKSAYNCCAINKFKNSFVSKTALKICLAQGCRCLDFEIYSVDNKPVISVSDKKDYNVKGTYNSIPFDEMLNIINSNAFGSGAPNPNDPLILHFRIKTDNKSIYDQMASDILANIDNYRILGPKFSYEFNGRNLGRVPLLLLTSKVIIVIDKTNSGYEGTKLEEYVNVTSNSVFMRGLRDYSVTYNPDFQELTEFNRKNLTLTMPDISPDNKNVKAPIHMSYGCQMICMNMQNDDDNLKFYNNFFAEKGKAFVLKPEKLRFIQKLMEAPAAQDPKLSYATRPVKEDYYSYNM